MPPRSKKTIQQQIEDARKKLAELEARAKSSRFDDVLAKHKQTISTIYADFKAASGQQRGIDAAILTTLAEAMGMKGMTITKKVQQRKK
jgi:hypothetical protein